MTGRSTGVSSTDSSQVATVACASAPSQDDPSAVTAPSRRYMLLSVIGRGGMGRVLCAYDPRLEREVAIKEVWGDLLDEVATRRLVGEARAMAKLSHPNVVEVYDVEEDDDGQVMVVMEYVRGQSLDRWLREEPRGWREVLDRFVAAGRGLVAAHEAGLLHRDFKPHNVLVGHDGAVKVGDFGLAKQHADESVSISSGVEPSADDLTADGTVVGTPRYMAPEQHRPALARGRPLTAAVDQYAFCVALWEALCGAPPFPGPRFAHAKSAGPPPWPDPSIPRPIAEAIRRGLSVRPEDRWPSMKALLVALTRDARRGRTRMMVGLAVVAGLVAPGLAYEAWAQDREPPCSASEAKLQGVWDAGRRSAVDSAFAKVGKPYAERARGRTVDALDTYADDWTAMHREACEATTVRGEQSAANLDLRMQCLQRAAVELDAIASVLAEADEPVVQRAQKLVGELVPLERCADLEALAQELEPPIPAEAEVVAQARERLAEARTLRHAGRYDAAKRAVEQARVLIDGVDYEPVQIETLLVEGQVHEELGEYAASEAALVEALRRAAARRQRDQMWSAATLLLWVVGDRLERRADAMAYRPMAEGLALGNLDHEAQVRNIVAMLLRGEGKYAEAEAEHRRAVAMREQALGPEHSEVAMCRNNLAIALALQGKSAEAEAEFRAVVALQEREFGPDHPLTANTRNNLGNALLHQGRFAEAEAEHRRTLASWNASLGPLHPDVANTRNNLASALMGQGKYAEAEAEHRAAIELLKASLGPDHPRVMQWRRYLAVALYHVGKYAEAAEEHRAVLQWAIASEGANHPSVAGVRHDLANDLHYEGKYAEAEVQHRLALSTMEAAVGSSHPALAGLRGDLALTLVQLGKPEEAETHSRAALQVLQAAAVTDSLHVANAHDRLADALHAQGRHVEAEVHSRKALAEREAAMSADHPDIASARHDLAAILLAQGRTDEARSLIELAWVRRQRDDIPVDERATTAFLRARILWAVAGSLEERREARRVGAEALALFGRAAPGYAPRADEVQRWLDEHTAA